MRRVQNDETVAISLTGQSEGMELETDPLYTCT